MKKELVIEEICTTFEHEKKRLIKSWNSLFPEDKLSSDIIISQDLREEMSESIREELEYSEDFDILSKIYELCTGVSLDAEDIYSGEEVEFEDEFYL